MDMNINPVSGVTQPTAAPAAKTPTAKPADTADTPAAPQPAPAAGYGGEEIVASASQYQAALRQAALSFKNVYAVSDTNFTIFKDATGKYITRYISLRDGSVTYIPEPTLVKQMQMSGSGSRLAIDA